MKVLFDEQAWEDYLYWQETDKKLAAKINTLIRDCCRSPFSSLGKPEPLRGRLSGWWSRRIDQEHRLVYRGQGETRMIAQCRHHY